MRKILLFLILSLFLVSCNKITLEDINLAIIEKNVEKLQLLIEKNEVDLNTTSASELIILALKSHFEEAVMILLESGVNPNIQVNNQNIADYLLKTEHENLFLLFISNGLDPNILINYDNESILYWAVLEKKEELIKKIISCGGNVNYIKKSKNIPVFDLAIRILPEEYHKFFMTNNLDYSVTNNKEESFLDAAIRKRKLNTALLLIEKSELMQDEILDDNFWLKFISYWSDGSAVLGNEILERGYNIKIDLPLYQEAIKKLHIEAVQWLFDSGVSPYNRYVDKSSWYEYDAFHEIDLMRKKLRSIDIDPHEEDQKVLDVIENILSNL